MVTKFINKPVKHFGKAERLEKLERIGVSSLQTQALKLSEIELRSLMSEANTTDCNRTCRPHTVS